MVDLPTYMRQIHEVDAASALERLQIVATDEAELANAGLDEHACLKSLEARLHVALDDEQWKLYLELSQAEARERNHLAAAAFWRGIKLGMKMGRWVSN